MYVVLFNPHSEEWLVFKYDENKELYAPNYGTPIANGKTIEDAIDFAVSVFDINPNEIDVY